MPRIADFHVIQDNNFTLSPSPASDIDQGFDFPLEIGTPLGVASILAFTVTVPKDVVSSFEVTVNDLLSEKYTYVTPKGPTSYTLHEIISPNKLKALPGVNNVQFKLKTGSSVQFGDVVLHFQRDI
ncbi:MAG TPA: hypothetical protein VFR31_23235 [Thermoanaerobaculia bacterium]|nr:hypothetical protein [Thermoanaerobaculia bacterium]